MNPIGIMQGRLTRPSQPGVIQEFPTRGWRQEFTTAAAIGFDEVELVFPSNGYRRHPLWNELGREQLRAIISETGVAASQVCGDYFMSHPFVRVSDEEREASLNVLRELIKKSAMAGVRGVQIPLCDNSEIRSDAEAHVVMECLKQVMDTASSHDVQLGLEASLPPEDVLAIIDAVGSPQLVVHYDIGDSAANGFDPLHEIGVLGHLIQKVHVKDRKLHGPSVPFGQGDARIALSLRTLVARGCFGLMTIQGARGDNDVKTAVRYRDYVMQILNGLKGAISTVAGS